MPIHQNWQSLHEVVSRSQRIVVLTGAGMSTASGIPDFRSKVGLYSTTPETVLSKGYFHHQTDKFYDFFLSALVHREAQPNQGHKILAKWGLGGRIQDIITQNIDGLHTKAGSDEVVEYHGTISTSHCTACRKEYSLDEVIFFSESKPRSGAEAFYYCECGGLIKPDVVLFGEKGYWFLYENQYDLRCRVHDADLILILGTSLAVYPFADLPSYRKEGTPMIIVNQGTTQYDNHQNVHTVKRDISDTISFWDSCL